MAGNSGEFVSVVEKNAKKEVDDLIKKVTELREAVNKSGNAFKGIKVPSDAKKFITELNSVLKQNNILLEQQLGLNDRLAQSTQRVNNARANASQRTQEEITNSRLLAANASRAAQANSTFANSYERLSAQQNIAARRVQDLIARGRTATQTQREYDRELRNAQTQFDQLNTRVLAADRAVGRFNRNVGNYPMQAAKGLKDLVAAFGLVGGVTAFAMIAKDVFQTTKEIQSLNFALKQVTGSNEAFGETQQFISRISEAYGIEILGLTRSYTQFLAASKNAIDEGKISAGQIQDIFESVSKASSAMGLSTEQQQGAFLALQQMISKGNVQAEEIRGQLAERLPGAFGILAKSMGVTEIELNKLLKDGKVLAAEVLPAFARELEKAYGVENLNRVESLTAATTRLGNEWTALIDTFASGEGVFSKVLISLITGITQVAEGLNFLFESADQKAKSFNKSLYNQVFSESIQAYQELGDKAAEVAQNNIDYNNDKLEQLNAEKTAIEANTKATEEQIAKLGFFDTITEKGMELRNTLSQQKKQYDAITNSITAYNAENDAAEKYIRKSTAATLADGTAKAKRQKADIDYLREVYQLRKQNFENQIADEERIMNDEEKNYDKRLAAANAYYFQKDQLLLESYEEDKRLADLEYKNQKKTYQTAISEGKATYSNIEELTYQHTIKKKRIDEDYEYKKTQNAIESAKKLQGVLDSIQDQSARNTIGSMQLRNIEAANKLLKNANEGSNFVELENKLRRLQEQDEAGEIKLLQIDLKRVQTDRERIILANKTLGQNESVINLDKRELELKKEILEKEQARLQAISDIRKETKATLDELGKSQVNSFLDDLGFSGLSGFFDQVEYEVINSAGEIEKRVGSTFSKIQDQAKTAAKNIRDTAKAAYEAGEIDFTQYSKQIKEANDIELKATLSAVVSVVEIMQQAIGFVRQNQQAAFDAELSGLEQEYSIRQKFANGNADAEEELERQLAEKKRDIRIREAKAAKETALFNAIINTAQAVVSALPNYALAAVVGALGAAQIALISSQEIPEYAEGTDNHKGGKAWVGDGGRHEVIRTPDGKLSITPNKATLIDLPKGSKVYPDIASSGLLSNGLPTQVVNTIEGLSKSDMETVMANTLAKMPIVNIDINKRDVSLLLGTSGAKRRSHNNRVAFKPNRIK